MGVMKSEYIKELRANQNFTFLSIVNYYMKNCKMIKLRFLASLDDVH